MTDLAARALSQAIAVFRKQKTLGDRALAQLDAGQLFTTLDPEMNSVAVIVKHLRGNMRSRWTDLLTSDGEKEDRNRDDEFVAPAERSREQVLAWWEEGWGYVFTALDGLAPDHLGATIHIRGEALTVLDGILRQIDHYGQHVGQIVFLAKHLRGAAWETLSIPRGKSADYFRVIPGAPAPPPSPRA